MKQFLMLIILNLALGNYANAQELSDVLKKEINQLLIKLENSDCKFNRNGDWYTSKEAKEHLEKKLAYILQKGEIKNTEQFIEYAASKSSMTGKPYLVQCPDLPAIESQQWLLEQLKQLRK